MGAVRIRIRGASAVRPAPRKWERCGEHLARIGAITHLSSMSTAFPLGSRCPVCAAAASPPFFLAADIPVHCNILWPEPEAATRAARGDMALSLCPECGLVFNRAFDPSLVTYDESYENSLHHSARFEAYANDLARDLASRLSLRDRLVVEAGCGKGEFLVALCRIAGARGLGIDASYDPTLASAAATPDVQFMREPFTTLAGHIVPSLVLCRHVIEHLPEPAPFVAELAAGAGRSDTCPVFIEVPNVLYTLRDLGIWDLIFEHCNYFSGPSLARLCTRAGIQVDRVYAAFGDQYLCVEGRPAAAPGLPSFATELAQLVQLAANFSAEYDSKRTYWRQRLGELTARGARAAIWGAGSKGITFVNVVPEREAVSCLVDLNPRKHGRFAPGTGHPVVPPEALQEAAPELVIVMNPLYRQEIASRLASLGVRCVVEVA